jgi:hypothetical protein
VFRNLFFTLTLSVYGMSPLGTGKANLPSASVEAGLSFGTISSVV